MPQTERRKVRVITVCMSVSKLYRAACSLLNALACLGQQLR
jgi:hypothetical protein